MSLCSTVLFWKMEFLCMTLILSQQEGTLETNWLKHYDITDKNLKKKPFCYRYLKIRKKCVKHYQGRTGSEISRWANSSGRNNSWLITICGLVRAITMNGYLSHICFCFFYVNNYFYWMPVFTILIGIIFIAKTLKCRNNNNYLKINQ